MELKNVQIHMKKYLQLVRVKQYIKNGFIFLAPFFAGTLFESILIQKLLLGFAAFCAAASSVYILNDIRDEKQDKMHPVKCKRPIASGMISKSSAGFLAVILFFLAWFILSAIQNVWFGKAHFFLVVYCLLNIGYSFGLKNIPIADIMILAAGFLLRVLYGAALCGTWVSDWLYLTVLMISIYMGAGKRRNEIVMKKSSETRKVLRFYSISYMDKIMNISITLAVAFYSFWSAGMGSMSTAKAYMIWTVPLMLAIIMRYAMVIERENYGDPTEIIYSDKPLFVLAVLYGIIGSILLYGDKGLFSIISISK